QLKASMTEQQLKVMGKLKKIVGENTSNGKASHQPLSFGKGQNMGLSKIFDNSLRLAWIEHIEKQHPILKSVSTPKFEQIENNRVDFSLDKSISLIDADKIKWPLELRKWKEGDSFIPLGMKGRKKISDFLIDEKMSLLEKENTFVLLSNNEIVWLIGHRISEIFKITEKTQNVLKLEISS
ncbi:MAG: tRNA lysidine(34) synthetase TilS, partial [Bacteroidia bacterium]